jgi:hypothetical protein
MFRRDLLRFGANALSRATNISLLSLSLPLFLLFRDASTWGIWLLSAAPAVRKPTLAVGRPDPVEGDGVSQNAQLFMTILCCAAAVIVMPSVLFLPRPIR